MNNLKKISLIGMLMLFLVGACELLPEVEKSDSSPLKSENSGILTVDLMAGQNIDVGEVQVWNDDQNLYVKYIVDAEGWCLTETHLHVAMSMEEIPQKNGNPIPGQFEYKGEHECELEVTYTIDLSEKVWECGDELYIAAHAVVQDETTCADAVVLLATENNHPADGATEMEARIYSITVLGNTTMLSNIPAPIRGDFTSKITDNFNGNAYDSENNRFYFTEFGIYGGPYNEGPSPLYFNDLEGNQILAGQLTGGTAGATIYNGKYYYIGTRTDDFYEVTFHEDGTVDTETKLADIFLNSNTPSKVLAFGDIDIRNEEGVDVVYGSATELPGGVVFFRMELNDVSTYTVIKSGDLYGAGGTQIAFGSDGVLYGVNARNPFELFSIDPSNGNTTFIDDMPVPFSDLASGPVCVPDEETAWGAGVDFPGNNWATYFTYTITCGNGGGGECQAETAWGGATAGGGSAWWYYFDTQGTGTQPIYAGQVETDGNVSWDGTSLVIDLGSWELQDVEEPVKVEGYDEIPATRPSAGLFTLYKGTNLTITGDGSRYYAIHLDVQLCPTQ